MMMPSMIDVAVVIMMCLFGDLCESCIRQHPPAARTALALLPSLEALRKHYRFLRSEWRA